MACDHSKFLVFLAKIRGTELCGWTGDRYGKPALTIDTPWILMVFFEKYSRYLCYAPNVVSEVVCGNGNLWYKSARDGKKSDLSN